MERKIIDIEISPETLDESLAENAGVMWEHNATRLVFHIDSRYAGDYSYYIEYRSLIGSRVRTQNLAFNEADNTVVYDIPVEMSSLMGVECFFNIVSVDEDGMTTQVIKPKKFCLDFTSSPDTDNTISRENDFSVNALLEAIRNNTFKGEKGDKGDAYSLTDNDRAEIAERINGDIYGLPFVREFEAQGKIHLVGVSQNGAVREMNIRAKMPDFNNANEDSPVNPEALSFAKIFIGKNEMEHILKPEMYSTFTHDSDVYIASYYVVPLYLKPNTKYVVVRYNKNYVGGSHSAIKNGSELIFMVHNDVNISKDYREFTTDETGKVYFVSTKIGVSYEVYKALLEREFLGLGIYECDKFAMFEFRAEKPLYNISFNNGDCADLISGDVTYNIEPYAIPETFDAENVTTFVSGDKTLYRYLLPIAQTPDARVDYDVASTHYKRLDAFINSDEDFSSVISRGGEYKGVYFDRNELNIYVYTDKSPEEFSTFITAQKTAGSPVTVIYRMKYPILQTISPTELTIDRTYKSIEGTPYGMTYGMKINGDISDALNTLLKAYQN